ncbi:hypothetical protein TNCV_2531111 [Trichonephila clavipes]|nr:hypothetical protein TNCV_2531111 [Trichonephila clavipes]
MGDVGSLVVRASDSRLEGLGEERRALPWIERTREESPGWGEHEESTKVGDLVRDWSRKEGKTMNAPVELENWKSTLDFFLPTLADRPKPLRELGGQSPKSRKDRTLVAHLQGESLVEPRLETDPRQQLRKPRDFNQDHTATSNT